MSRRDGPGLGSFFAPRIAPPRLWSAYIFTYLGTYLPTDLSEHLHAETGRVCRSPSRRPTAQPPPSRNSTSDVSCWPSARSLSLVARLLLGRPAPWISDTMGRQGSSRRGSSEVPRRGCASFTLPAGPPLSFVLRDNHPTSSVQARRWSGRYLLITLLDPFSLSGLAGPSASGKKEDVCGMRLRV